MVSVQDGVGRVSFLTLAHVFFRSFFSQGSWSTQYRQNVGFAFCIAPAGRQLYKRSEDYRAFLMRHLEHYNGNPFMVSLVLGAVINMEERLSRGTDITEDDILRFKKVVGPATGSSGDRLFWSTLRPFGLLVGLAVALLFGIWGGAAFVAAFNIPLLVFKWHWLNAGYRLGPRVVSEIRNKHIERAERTMENLGSVFVSFLAILALTVVIKKPQTAVWITVGIVGTVVSGIALLRQSIPLQTILAVSITAAVGLGFIITFFA